MRVVIFELKLLGDILRYQDRGHGNCLQCLSLPTPTHTHHNFQPLQLCLTWSQWSSIVTIISFEKSIWFHTSRVKVSSTALMVLFPKLSSIFKSSPSNIDISPSPNIAYLQWIQQDNLILSTLMASYWKCSYSSHVSRCVTIPWTKFLLPIKGSHCSYLNLTSHYHQRCFFYHWLFSSYQEARGWTCNCWSTPLQGCHNLIHPCWFRNESLIYTLIAWSNTLKLEDVYSFSLTIESQLNYHKQATPIINANANIATKQSSQTYGQGYNGGYPG